MQADQPGRLDRWGPKAPAAGRADGTTTIRTAGTTARGCARSHRRYWPRSRAGAC